MTKRDFLRLSLPLAATAPGLAQAASYIVVSITPLDEHRADVKLKNPRTGYVHSVTALRSEIAGLRVGDRVSEIRNGGDIRLEPAGGSRPAPPEEPGRSPIRIAGQANHRVWSGYWWPQAPGRIRLVDPGGPLDLYQRLTGDTAPLETERRYHANPPAHQQGWSGHCDGFSVSSSLYPEPVRAVRASSAAGVAVVFEPGHIKGLLALTWAGYEWRNTGRAAGGPAGAAALDFHRFLLFYIREHGLPLVVNTAKGVVWNYPCDRFSMEAVPGAAGQWQVTARLSLADDGVEPNIRGKKELAYVQRYQLTGDPTDINAVRSASWISSDSPGWLFCPSLGVEAGWRIRPSEKTKQFHPFVEGRFEMLAEALARVSSGEQEKENLSEFTLQPA